MTSAPVPNSGRWLALALLLLPRAAPAAITPDAQPVVDRYLRAAGGREALMGERSIYLRGTLSAYGLAGTLESWSQHPDRSASVTSIGPFTLREGYDGKLAWRVDQNGKFALRDGRDLEEAQASAWFVNDRWLAADQGGGQVAFVGVEQDSAGSYDVLEVAPPIGKSRRLWFSKRTGLLDRVVSRSDQRTVTNRFLDYATMAGRVRARVMTVEIEGMPGNTARMTLDSVVANPRIDPAVFAPPSGGAADARFLGASPARIPFDYSVRHVWVKVSVNGGPPEDFLLDTGASVTVIDSAYAVSRGLQTAGRIEVAGAGASGGASFSQLDSLVVAGEGSGVALSGQKVAVLSINPYVEPFFMRTLAGVLGYDFISRFVMEVDFDQERLTLHEPKSFEYRGAAEAVPMTMSGNIPVVKAVLDERYEGEFRLDVGSGSTVDLHSPFVERHGLRAQPGKSFDVVGGGFGGTFTSTIRRMKSMRIGSHSWNDPLVVLSQTSLGALASEDYAGNIGNHVLERFRCTFDYERRKVYLEPAKRHASRDRFSLGGFQLVRRDGRIEAMQVLPGSPGAQAGLVSGDTVVSLDGRRIESYDVDGLRAVFEDGVPGSRHTLEVLRSGKKKKLRIKLAEML